MDDQNTPRFGDAPSGDASAAIVIPKQAAVTPPLEVRIAGHQDDPKLQEHMVRTYEKLRMAIIIVTALFLFTLTFYRNGGVDSEPPRYSISAYYHHNNDHWRMKDIFVAALFSVGAMLAVYRGYTPAENLALTIAGLALIGVVGFPMDWPLEPGSKILPAGVIGEDWPEVPEAERTTRGTAHYICAVMFFGGLAYVCLTQARKTLQGMPIDLAGRKRLFENLYRVVGFLMVTLPILSFVLYFRNAKDYVYRVEFAGVAVFLAYWLIKTVELRLRNHVGSTEGESARSLPPPEENRPLWLVANCCLVVMMVAIFWVYSFFTTIERERRAAGQEAVSRIYPMDNEVTRYQAENPGLRTLLRNDPDGTRWNAQKDETIREKFRALCSINGNLFEYYLLARNTIDDHPHGKDIIKAWDAYLEDICKNSYGFRGYIEDNPAIWSEPFMKLFRKYTKGKDFAKNIRPVSDPTQVGNSKEERE